MSSSIPVVSNSFECGGQVAHPRKVESKNFLEKKKKDSNGVSRCKAADTPSDTLSGEGA